MCMCQKSTCAYVLTNERHYNAPPLPAPAARPSINPHARHPIHPQPCPPPPPSSSAPCAQQVLCLSGEFYVTPNAHLGVNRGCTAKGEARGGVKWGGQERLPEDKPALSARNCQAYMCVCISYFLDPSPLARISSASLMSVISNSARFLDLCPPFSASSLCPFHLPCLVHYLPPFARPPPSLPASPPSWPPLSASFPFIPPLPPLTFCSPPSSHLPSLSPLQSPPPPLPPTWCAPPHGCQAGCCGVRGAAPGGSHESHSTPYLHWQTLTATTHCRGESRVVRG